jgi:V8-like Glu-specific endopeptidase
MKNIDKYIVHMVLAIAAVFVVILSPVMKPAAAQTRQQSVVSVEGLTKMYVVPSPNVRMYPYDAVVKIISSFPKCKSKQGSGAFVSSDGVFTAAHVVYIKDCGGYATDVVIIRGYDKGIEPFGRTRATRIEVPSQYLNGGDPNYDFAALLTKDKSDSFFGYGVPSGDLGDIMIVGYPVEKGKYDGETMLASPGPASMVSVNALQYPLNTYEGMSGGPILQKNGVQRGVTHYRVIGVHTRGKGESRFPVNFGAGFLDHFLRNMPRNK